MSRSTSVAVLFGLALTVETAANAADIVWAGGGSGNWTDSANWVGGVVPSSSDSVGFKGWAPLVRSGWTVTATNTYMSNTASLIKDGRRSTYWWSNASITSSVYITIDFGSAQTFGGIDMVEIVNGTDFPVSYGVYTSNDGTNWSSAVYTTSSGAGDDQMRFADQTARYIKIAPTASKGNWWAISELTVWGTGGDTQLALWGMTPSASATAGGAAANATDFSWGTVWSPGANQVNGQYFKVDMGASRTVSAITMDAYSRTGDYPNAYKVELSANDSSYTQVATGSGAAEFIHVTFTQQAARYIKVTQTGSVGNWWSMYEFHIFGVPVNLSTQATTTLTGINHTNSLTFTQAHAITINGDWNQSAGTFTGGSSTITVTNDLNLSGGTYTSTSGRLEVRGSFNNTAATFNNSSGTLMLTSTGAEAFATNSQNFYNVIINDGLVGYWKLDDGGTPIVDSSGYAHSGTLSNTPTWTGSGASTLFTNSNSMITNGSNQSARIGRDTTLEPTSFTIAAWVKSNGTQIQYAQILAKSYNNGGSSPYSSYDLHLNDSGSDSTTVTLPTGYSGPNIDKLTTATGAVPNNNTWTHVVGVYDPAGSAPQKRIYINGVLNTSKTVTNAVLYDTSSNGDVYLGQNGGSAQWFKGTIDEARVYNRALTPAEIYALYAGNQPGTYSAVHTMSGSPTVLNDFILSSGKLIAGSGTLGVGGGWANYGGVFTSTGTVALSSGFAEVIRSAGQSFNNLTLQGTGSWTLEDWLKVDGTLAFTTGGLSAGAYSIHAGAITKSTGTFTAGTGTMVIDTTSSSNVTENSGFGFATLRVESPKETGLVGYWRLDEGQGTVINDSSGTGNDGTLTSTAQWIGAAASLPSTIGYDKHAAVSFTGSSSSYGTLGTTSLPAANASQSISGWINLGTNSGGSDHYIVTMHNGSNSGVTLGIHNTGVLGVWKWGATLLASVTAPSTGSWHHVAYTFDGTTHKLYLDGGTPGTSTTAANTATPTTATIGTYAGGSLYTGSLDDLRIYNVALTAAQVKNLAAGRYSGVGGGSTVVLGANSSASTLLSVDNGTLSTGNYTVNASSASNAVAVGSGGTYTVGGNTQTMAGGLTVSNGGTVNMATASGIISIGSGKILNMDGTLNASSTSATIQGAGTYDFNVCTSSTGACTLNISGLNVKNTTANGMYINSNGTASVTTFTRFDNIAFTNGFGTGAGNYNLRIYGPSLNLTSSGCSFDSGVTATVANNVYLQGTSARAIFGNATCASNKTDCEAYDLDDDATVPPDGVADGTGGVVQWIRGAQTDTSGSIEGFPTAAFNWSSFTYYATYVAYHDTGGAGGTADTVFVRTSTGAANYSWSTGTGEEIIGTPRWDTVSNVHYLYVATNDATTTGGKVYRLIDNGTTLTQDTVAPWNGAGNNPYPCSCTITTPLAQDTTYLYWGGTVPSPTTHKFWTLSKTASSPRLSGNQPLATSTTTNNTAPAIWTSGANTYAFLGLNGRVSKMNTTTQAIDSDNTNPTMSYPVTGRITIINNTLYAGDDNGGFWSLDPGTNFATLSGLYKNWGYRDTTTHATCSGVCQIKSHYYDATANRVYFGDQDGHLWALSSGASSAAVISASYPYRPGTASDAFTTAPFFRSGVLLAGTTTGTLYIIDQASNASTVPAKIQTYQFGSSTAISGIAYDYAASNYLISTANSTNKDGKLYVIAGVSDPTNTYP